MKLLGSTGNQLTKDENCENGPNLKITEVVLVHCILVNNDYQLDSRVLYTFVPDKSFDQLLDILPTSVIFLKTFNSKFWKMKYQNFQNFDLLVTLLSSLREMIELISLQLLVKE